MVTQTPIVWFNPRLTVCSVAILIYASSSGYGQSVSWSDPSAVPVQLALEAARNTGFEALQPEAARPAASAECCQRPQPDYVFDSSTEEEILKALGSVPRNQRLPILRLLPPTTWEKLAPAAIGSLIVSVEFSEEKLAAALIPASAWRKINGTGLNILLSRISIYPSDSTTRAMIIQAWVRANTPAHPEVSLPPVIRPPR